jgi:AraC-like DNA-binding protein
MTAARQGHSPLLLEFLAQVLERVGIDGGSFLREVELDGPESEVRAADPARVDAALLGLAAKRGDPAFALTLARAEIQGPLGLYGNLIWLSGTLRDALERAARFYSLCTQRATLSLDAPAGDAVARIRRHVQPGPPLGRTLPEFAFATLLLRARRATDGRFAVKGVRFAHEVPDAAPYGAYFGAPVTFGAPGDDELAFDASLLELRLATADPVTAVALEAQATRMQEVFPGRTTLLDQVRRAVADAPVGAAALPTIARRVGIGARSLRRRLAAEESVTLREVLDSVRRERARELLSAGRSVKEVALLLGFSEPSAFSRAYKRWTGSSPRATA